MPQTALPPLDKLDPAQAWQPWQPSAPDPWNLKWAGHLYRRAAFGGTLDELREAVRVGFQPAIDKLLKGDTDPAWSGLVNDIGERVAAKNSPYELRGWWLYVILSTPHPLREKMTLFWHNHFATSVAKVQRTLMMFHQNQLLRRHALGKFGPMLLEMSKDPAMLVWLDSNNNVKGKPNENYARELMELFSLGTGHYTEKDIREGARAFTGWHTNDNKFEFVKSLHDAGRKTFLGQTGDWDGGDIVRIVLLQPAAAQFLVRKLYAYLISENTEPPAAFLEPLADSFRKSDYDIAALVGTMLRSRHFFSDHAYRQRIKTPVEYTVGTVRVCWRRDSEDRLVEPRALVTDLGAMGEELFAPPNVKGWPGGRTWLNSATMLARHNFAQKTTAGNLPANPAPANEGLFVAVRTNSPAPTAPKETDPPDPSTERDIAYLVNREKIADPARVIDLLLDATLQGGIAPAVRQKLVAFVGEGKPKDSELNRRIRETAHAIMTLPEYQLA